MQKEKSKQQNNSRGISRNTFLKISSILNVCFMGSIFIIDAGNGKLYSNIFLNIASYIIPVIFGVFTAVSISEKKDRHSILKCLLPPLCTFFGAFAIAFMIAAFTAFGAMSVPLCIICAVALGALADKCDAIIAIFIHEK